MSSDIVPESYCGHVAIIGRPNVGKSTLLNHVLRQKLSITSRKPQTTRHNVLGVDTKRAFQAIYLDTPGIHDDVKRAINRYMVKKATSILVDVDLVVMVLDRNKWTQHDDLVLQHIKRAGKPTFAIINKTDLIQDKADLLPVIDRLAKMQLFDEVIPVSALKQEGLDVFRKQVFAMLPARAHLFPPDQLTDQSERFLVGEIIREKLMRSLGDELPHRTGVVIEAFKQRDDLVEIQADIYVERNGQKRIVIGTRGEKLKRMGSEARKDIEQLLGCKVMLHLWVKVKAGWTYSRAELSRMGYD